MTENEQNIEVMNDLRARLDKVLEASVPSSDHKHPDPVKHKYISFGKSGIRIIGALVLVSGNFVMAGVCFALAEVLGIVEELV